MSRQSTLVLLSLWSLLPSSARADVVLPSGLPPGTEFRVVFTTADGMTADSASVGDYNGFATAEANQNPTLAALGATWYALVSTPTVNVIDNVPSPSSRTSPVYNTAGQLVVASTGTLWAHNNTLLNPVCFDQFGNLASWQNVCTGSYANGYAVSGQALGQFYYDSSQGYWESPWLGEVGSTSKTWVNWGYWHDIHLSAVQDREFHYYALSSPITVATPEPSTLGLLAAATGVLLSWRVCGGSPAAGKPSVGPRQSGSSKAEKPEKLEVGDAFGPHRPLTGRRKCR